MGGGGWSQEDETQRGHPTRVSARCTAPAARDNGASLLARRSRMRFPTTTTALLASLAALGLVFQGPASAAIDPASYQHVDVIFAYPGAGGFISCPERTTAVASGATS